MAKMPVAGLAVYPFYRLTEGIEGHLVQPTCRNLNTGALLPKDFEQRKALPTPR